MSSSGIGKFESLTILVVIICLLAGGLYLILNMSKNAKYNSMYQSAIKFVDITSGSEDPFQNYTEYYLTQALDEELLTKMKSPFSEGNCDVNESKVEYDGDNNVYYVTLKCGDYLIKSLNSTDKNFKVYKVSEWSDNKTGKNDQSRDIYSCDSCGVDGEYEEALFTYLYNKNNGTSYNFLNEIKDVEVHKKTQYRTLEVAYEK